MILVNSKFTAEVFKQTFTRLPHISPEVLYPSLNTKQFDIDGIRPSSLSSISQDKTVFLSINRYERKKNLGLAVYALAGLPPSLQSSCHLIIAGGYDSRVAENVEHRQELGQLVDNLKVNEIVTFLESPPDEEKCWLLQQADCLLYTPTGEHFGIVPVEAMYSRTPVIAVNSGGPTETVVHGQTGWLCDPTPQAFSQAMEEAVRGGRDLKKELGVAGRERVNRNFSFTAFAKRWDTAVCHLAVRWEEDRLRKQDQGYSLFVGLAVTFHFVLAMVILFWMVFGTMP
jgi:alpha-1,3/alpha-1,6-mannosyltransferase